VDLTMWLLQLLLRMPQLNRGTSSIVCEDPWLREAW